MSYWISNILSRVRIQWIVTYHNMIWGCSNKHGILNNKWRQSFSIFTFKRISIMWWFLYTFLYETIAQTYVDPGCDEEYDCVLLNFPYNSNQKFRLKFFGNPREFKIILASDLLCEWFCVNEIPYCKKLSIYSTLHVNANKTMSQTFLATFSLGIFMSSIYYTGLEK